MSTLTVQQPVPQTTRRNAPAPSGSLRVGLLGAGYIAEWHAKAVQSLPDVKLVSVADLSAGRAEACARRFGIPHVYRSLEEMLAGEPLDVVHILLPPERHCQAAMAALEAGTHVLLEKPMGASAEECDALIQRAAERGLAVGVGHNFLFYEPYEQLRRDVAEGVLGRIDHVTITWNKELPQAIHGPFDLWMLRDPRNIMLEIGPHSVAHMLDLVGAPGEVHVRVTNPVNLPSGQRFYRRWQVDGLSGQAAVQLNFSFISGFAEHTIHVRGTLASATVDFERNTYVLHRHTPHDVDVDRLAMLRNQARSLRTQGWRNFRHWALSKFKLSQKGSPYGHSIAQAARAVYASLNGKSDSRVSASFGREVVAICEQIGQAARIAPSASPVHSLATAEIQPRILLLGATGFIGRELLRQLTGAGHAVRVLARSPSRLPTDLDGSRVQIARGDLANPADVDRALAGVSCVYHLARAMANTWEEYQTHDVEVTRRLAERCLEMGVKRFIYTSSIAVYDTGRRAGVITEQAGADPHIHRRNSYSRAKAVTEEILMDMHRQRKLPVVIFRPAIVIGQGASPFHWGIGMWRFGSICQTWGDGANKLPLVLVEDVARALVLALDAPDIAGQSFNLSSDPCISAQEYLDELDRAMGIRLQRFPTPIHRYFLGDILKWIVKILVRHPGRQRPSYRDWNARPHDVAFDCSRARTLLGWQPVSNRDELIHRGIHLPARDALA